MSRISWRIGVGIDFCRTTFETLCVRLTLPIPVNVETTAAWGWKKPYASPLDVGLDARVWDSGFGVGGSGVGTFGTPFWNLSKRFGV